MDSLTQIVLGAACGEVALGRKIGNKAMLFGAFGGTIPDLDVMIGSLLFDFEIDQLAFHRGFMHSIVFACIASVVMGNLFYRLYNSGKRRNTTFLKDWVWLFFLSIFTHPILDSFTPYGTQLFVPFTDYRVAFNSIAVIDPMYTVPFLCCMIFTLFLKRTNPKRMKWTRVGIYLSSAYLLFTWGNKHYMDTVFKEAFEKAAIPYHRFSMQPTILNTFLWYGVAETDTDYQLAFYSLFDQNDIPVKFTSIPKNHDLLDINHPDLKTLRWFSQNFFTVQFIDTTGQLIYRDLRYPLIREDDVNSSIFSYELVRKGDRWDIKPLFDGAISRDDLNQFIKRIFGR